MKMTNLALAASVFALSAARADGFTFTVGTEIPLGEDVDPTATMAEYVTTTGTATLDSRGKTDSTYYVLGTRNTGTTITLALNNADGRLDMLSLDGDDADRQAGDLRSRFGWRASRCCEWEGKELLAGKGEWQ